MGAEGRCSPKSGLLLGFFSKVFRKSPNDPSVFSVVIDRFCWKAEASADTEVEEDEMGSSEVGGEDRAVGLGRIGGGGLFSTPLLLLLARCASEPCIKPSFYEMGDAVALRR